jgi:hypothetical protein
MFVVFISIKQRKRDLWSRTSKPEKTVGPFCVQRQLFHGTQSKSTAILEWECFLNKLRHRVGKKRLQG